MRWLVVGLSMMTSLGCAGARDSAAVPSRADEAQAAQLAYSDYCNACPRSQGCGCMAAKDFASERWTAQAGPYLRAMREYYDCQLSSTMADASLEAGNGPTAFDTSFDRSLQFSDRPRPVGGWQAHCGPHACLGSLKAMQDNLAASRVPQYSPASGEMLECRSARNE